MYTTLRFIFLVWGGISCVRWDDVGWAQSFELQSWCVLSHSKLSAYNIGWTHGKILWQSLIRYIRRFFCLVNRFTCKLVAPFRFLSKDWRGECDDMFDWNSCVRFAPFRPRRVEMKPCVTSAMSSCHLKTGWKGPRNQALTLYLIGLRSNLNQII